MCPGCANPRRAPPPPRGHTQDKHQISLTKARSATAQELARVRGHGMDISTEAPPVGDKQHSVGVKKRQRSWLQLRQEVSVCLTEQCSLMAWKHWWQGICRGSYGSHRQAWGNDAILGTRDGVWEFRTACVFACVLGASCGDVERKKKTQSWFIYTMWYIQQSQSCRHENLCLVQTST